MVVMKVDRSHRSEKSNYKNFNKDWVDPADDVDRLRVRLNSLGCLVERSAAGVRVYLLRMLCFSEFEETVGPGFDPINNKSEILGVRLWITNRAWSCNSLRDC